MSTKKFLLMCLFAAVAGLATIGFTAYLVQKDINNKTAEVVIKGPLSVESMPDYGNGNVRRGIIVEMPVTLYNNWGDYLMFYVNPMDEPTKLLTEKSYHGRVPVIVPRAMIEQMSVKTHARIASNGKKYALHANGREKNPEALKVGDEIVFYCFARGNPDVFMMGTWNEHGKVIQ